MGGGSDTYGKIVNGSYDGEVVYNIGLADKADAASLDSFTCKLALDYKDGKGGEFSSYINGTWWSQFPGSPNTISGKF